MDDAYGTNKDCNFIKSTTNSNFLWKCPHEDKNHLDAVAAFTFTAEEDNEIGFVTGDIVHILWDDHEDWWKGIANGKSGFFPANYVHLIPSKVTRPEASNETDRKDGNCACALSSNLLKENGRTNIKTESQPENLLGNSYDSLDFKCYSIYTDKREYNELIKVSVSNPDKISVTCDELKALIQLKFNNLFLNICNFEEIHVNNVEIDGNQESRMDFLVRMDKPLST